MPLYPLGISRRRDVPSVPKQAAGSIDMRWILVDDLACAFIDAPHAAIPPALHTAALDAIHRRIGVLPVRFGAAFRDESEIRSLLQDRRHELLDHLSRLDCTCEMGLRMDLPTTADRCSASAPARRLPSSTDATASSRPESPLAYIEERRTHYRRADANIERDRLIVQRFVECLDGCYRQWRKLESSPSYSIRLAFLVEREAVTAVRSRLEDACNVGQEGRWAVLGPWPPYSFV